MIQFGTQRLILAVVTARAIQSFVYFGFLTYNSIIVVRLINGTPQQAGVLVALASLLLAGGASQTGRITASFDSRTYPLIGANLCLGTGLTLVAIASSIPVAVLGVIGLGASFGLLLSLYRSWITELAPEAIRGRVVSLSEALGRVGSTAAPLVIGVLIGITQPVIGFGSAVRWVSVGIGVVGGVVGVLLVVVASRHRRSRSQQAGSE